MIQKLRIASLIGIQFLILAHIYIFGDEKIPENQGYRLFHRQKCKYGQELKTGCL
jgi:hypothetical protein